jgi:dTDP-6-deoxy-L-talose 4-dehydrogenase (NAD+)
LFHFEHNLMADYRFIKGAVEAGVSQVLVTGTCFEYGMKSGPLSEQTEPQPGNPYGLAKNTLRLFLENLQCAQPFILQWARLFYLHGEGQNPNSLLAALDRAIEAGDDTFNMSAGEQLRDYLAIETAASHLVSILQRRDFNGVINCSSGQPIAVRSLVERRLQERGTSIRLNLGHYPYPTHEPMAFWGVADRLQQLLMNSNNLEEIKRMTDGPLSITPSTALRTSDY